jgi:hypothetical protein
MVKPVILYRRNVNPSEDAEEIAAANAAGFTVLHNRTEVDVNDFVIGRYSVLPFYKELELDVTNSGGTLVNSFRQHQFIADMAEWCEVLGDLTPKLYRRLQDLPEKGEFVLKGQTNSKKFLWNTHMYANGKSAAGEVWSRLMDDMLISQQEIYIRDYVPLQNLGTGFNGLPISKEFRFFVYSNRVVCGDFYWSSHVEDIKVKPDASEVPEKFLSKVINKIGNKARFYALDVAQTSLGEWIVVEINDGQQSGLSCIDPKVFYSSLRRLTL